MTLFLIGALRAIIEMLGLCLLAQGILYIVAGQRRSSNPIYQLFALITKPPCQIVSKLLPARTGPRTIGFVYFFTLLALWLGLAIARKFV